MLQNVFFQFSDLNPRVSQIIGVGNGFLKIKIKVQFAQVYTRAQFLTTLVHSFNLNELVFFGLRVIHCNRG
jgi:hypothetical protein